MSKQDLIDYQNSVKQSNFLKIAELTQSSNTIDQIVAQMNVSINEYTVQKAQIQQQITDVETYNTYIDEIIAILSQ